MFSTLFSFFKFIFFLEVIGSIDFSSSSEKELSKFLIILPLSFKFEKSF